MLSGAGLGRPVCTPILSPQWWRIAGSRLSPLLDTRPDLTLTPPPPPAVAAPTHSPWPAGQSEGSVHVILVSWCSVVEFVPRTAGRLASARLAAHAHNVRQSAMADVCEHYTYTYI